jgi:hypothetical protein
VRQPFSHDDSASLPFLLFTSVLSTNFSFKLIFKALVVLNQLNWIVYFQFKHQSSTLFFFLDIIESMNLIEVNLQVRSKYVFFLDIIESMNLIEVNLQVRSKYVNWSIVLLLNVLDSFVTLFYFINIYCYPKLFSTGYADETRKSLKLIWYFLVKSIHVNDF